MLVQSTAENSFLVALLSEMKELERQHVFVCVARENNEMKGNRMCVAERLDQKRAQLSVGSSSEVSLKVSETDLSNLTATIRSPSGMEEPCALKRLANGHLGISFTPRETGEHLVNVYR